MQIGKVQGKVGFEETWRREEGLALVELHVAPVAEVGAGDFGFANVITLISQEAGRRMKIHGQCRDGFSQHLSLLQMFLIVDEVIPLLLECARIDACVFSGIWGVVHANGP